MSGFGGAAPAFSFGAKPVEPAGGGFSFGVPSATTTPTFSFGTPAAAPAAGEQTVDVTVRFSALCGANHH